MGKQELREPSLFRIRGLGWGCLVLAMVLMVFSVLQWPGDAPTLDGLYCVIGQYLTIETASGPRTDDDYYRIYLYDGSSYWMSGIYDLDAKEFTEKVQQGDVIRLYLLDDSVYGIYDENGEPIHSFEDSFDGEVRNCYGLAIFGGFWLLLGGLIALNARRIHHRLMKEYQKDAAQLENGSGLKKDLIKHLWS